MVPAANSSFKTPVPVKLLLIVGRLAVLVVEVFDPEDDSRLPGVTLVGSGTGGGTLDAETDGNGTARIPHLTAGTWRLRASLDGYRDRRTTVELTAGETTTLELELGR